MRLFVALDIPQAVRVGIAKFIEDLRNATHMSSAAVRWTKLENLHITLKFIGEIPANRVDFVRTALAAIPPRDPIELIFRARGFFPSDRAPEVFWLSVEGGPRLHRLVAAIDGTLEPLGISRHLRPFSPHLTLARFGSSFDAKQLVRFRASFATTGPLNLENALASEFYLYRSVLKPTGAEYTQLATYGLASEGEAR